MEKVWDERSIGGKEGCDINKNNTTRRYGVGGGGGNVELNGSRDDRRVITR